MTLRVIFDGEAEAELKKRLGPYGSITVLNAARQIVVNDDHPLQFALPSGASRMKKSA